MKKTLISFCAVIFLSNIIFAQAIDTVSTKTYGDSSYDYGSSIIQTDNDSFIISGSIGTKFPWGGYTTDIWLFKIDNLGNIISSHNYGGMNGGQIVRSNNQEFFVAAETFNQNTLEDIEILKIDNNADTIWTKSFYYPDHEYKPLIKNTPDGGLIILGYSYGYQTGTRLIKIDQFGDTLWTKFYSGYPCGITLGIDNSYIVLSTTGSYDSTYITKYDSIGRYMMSKALYLPHINLNRIINTYDNAYLVVGNESPSSDSSYVFVSKIKSDFTLDWQKSYLDSLYSFASSIIEIDTGNYCIVGSEQTNSYAASDGFILFIDNTGGIISKKSFGGGSNDEFNDVVKTGAGEFIVIGSTNSFGAGESDIWILKIIFKPTFINYGSNNIPQKFDLYDNYPNPFNPCTKISWQMPVASWQTLKVYDILGSEVATLVDEYKPRGNFELTWNAANLPSGVYFYQLRAGAFIQTKKMILLK